MIGSFLVKLVEDPDLLGSYMQNPEGVMEAEGLSAEEREVVSSGDLKRLRDALQEEFPDKEIFVGNAPIGAFGHVPQVFGNVPQVGPPPNPDEAE
jgi:hypothetical protein